VNILTSQVAGAVLMTALCASSVNAADNINFDPDGAGSSSALRLSAFDWLPGSSLGQGVLPPGDLLNPSASVNYAQLSLANFLDTDNKIITGTGLAGDYEITMVMSYPELTSAVTPSIVSSVLDPSVLAGPNHVKIYWDSTPDADALAGTGYDDGLVILEGTVSSASGVFSVWDFDLGDTNAFDQSTSPSAQYAGITSVDGSGGPSVVVQVDTYDPDFFPTEIPLSIDFGGLIVTPFETVNPSAKFVNPTNGVVVAPDIGDKNGVSGPDMQFQIDPNSTFSVDEPIEKGICRMTGGGVTKDGEIVLSDEGEVEKLGAAHDGKNRYTFGGQIGAPTVQFPSPSGEWTHHQFKGPDGKFVFRVGTRSSPADTRVWQVTCADPGYCNPARPAPFKQLDWVGVGSFRSVSSSMKALGAIADNKLDYTTHFVEVHFEDIGEPGPGGKQPKSDMCTHVIGTSIDEAEDCSNCPDVYQISIHADETPESAVIYSVGGFIDNGNIQIHPEVGSHVTP